MMTRLSLFPLFCSLGVSRHSGSRDEFILTQVLSMLNLILATTKLEESSLAHSSRDSKRDDGSFSVVP